MRNARNLDQNYVEGAYPDVQLTCIVPVAVSASRGASGSLGRAKVTGFEMAAISVKGLRLVSWTTTKT